MSKNHINFITSDGTRNVISRDFSFPLCFFFNNVSVKGSPLILTILHPTVKSIAFWESGKIFPLIFSIVPDPSEEVVITTCL